MNPPRPLNDSVTPLPQLRKGHPLRASLTATGALCVVVFSWVCVYALWHALRTHPWWVAALAMVCLVVMALRWEWLRRKL